ncbi:MAG: pyridoxal phosphate-dependent aminotransferase [Clostridia bacterium]
MENFSKRCLAVSPSLTLAITAKSNELKAKGVNVISFGVGEPDFNTPKHIVEAGKEALDKGMTKYTASSGTPVLRQAVCDKFKRDNDLVYDKTQIVVSNGAKQSLFNALQVLVDEGDEVIILAPYWLTYPELVGICGGKSVVVNCLAENEFIVNPSDLEKAITSKTKALILNSPSNPTGAVYSREQLESIAAVLRRHPNIWVVADEIYEKLVYDGNKHVSIASLDGMYDRTIVINGMSKAYAMTGWRIGFAAAPTTRVAKLMDGLQSHESSNANTPSQYASQVALNSDESFLDEMRSTFLARRNRMLEKLSTIKGVKAIHAKGAFYIMVDVSSFFGKSYNGVVIDGANKLASLIIDNVSVAVIPCEGFGAPNFIRLSYATNIEKINEGLDRIKDFLAEVK